MTTIILINTDGTRHVQTVAASKETLANHVVSFDGKLYVHRRTDDMAAAAALIVSAPVYTVEREATA